MLPSGKRLTFVVNKCETYIHYLRVLVFVIYKLYTSYEQQNKYFLQTKKFEINHRSHRVIYYVQIT